MQHVAQSWLVCELTRSPMAIGLVAFFDSMPRLLVGALGGAIADRFDRRRVLMITQTLAMIQAFIFWLAVWFQVIAFWHIVVLSFFLGVVNPINQTARQSLVNTLVPREELLNAIGLQSSVFISRRFSGRPRAIIIAYIGSPTAFGQCAELSRAHRQPSNDGIAAMGAGKRIDKASGGHQGRLLCSRKRRIFHIISISYVMAMFGARLQPVCADLCDQHLHVGPTGFGVPCPRRVSARPWQP
jgi:MFS family permease